MPIKLASSTLLSTRPITSSLLLSVLLTSCGAGTEGISKQIDDISDATVEIPTTNETVQTIGAANLPTESSNNDGPLTNVELAITPEPAELIVVIPTPTLSRQGIDSIETPAESLFAEHEHLISSDSKPLVHSYVWYANGIEIEGNITPYITAENIERGVSYTVALKVTDGTSQELSDQSQPYIIDNQPPEFDLNISPKDPLLGMDIRLALENESDLENDPVDYTYEWFVNDALVQGTTSSILSSSFLKNDDEVYVRVTADDGYDTVQKQTEVLTYAPRLSELIVLDQPDYLNYGEENTFQVEFVSKIDGTPLETKLVAGPPGLEYIDGYLSWNPKPAMFTDTEIYYAYFEASNAEMERVDLTVKQHDHKPTLAKGIIETPYLDDNIFVGDFHSTGSMDIFTTNSYNRIYTAAIKNGELVQTWQYPFSIPPYDSKMQLVPFGDDSEGFFTVSANAIYKIDSKNSKPMLVYEEPDRLNDIEYAIYQDFDQDGKKELAVIYELNHAHILNPDTFEIDRTIDFNSVVNYDNAKLAANVDNDNSIEIINASGEVIDGATGEVEWLHSKEFGKRISIGDINGDGSNEIVGITEQSELKVFNARTKTETFIAQLNACSFRMINVDEDPAEEIVSGDCDTGQIKIHDLSQGSLDLQYYFYPQIDSYRDGGVPNTNEIVRGFNVADLNGDGVDELIWAQKSNAFDDKISAASIPKYSGSMTELISLDSVNYAHMESGQFEVFGRSEISPGDTRTIYSAAVSDPHNDIFGSRVLSFNDNGDETVLGDIPSAIWPSENEFFIDSDGDSVLETLFITGYFELSQLEHRSLDDFSLINTISEVSDIDGMPVGITKFRKAILPNGLEVALYSTTDNHFHVYDVINQSKIWKSPVFSSPITSFIELKDEGESYVLITTRDEISKWALNSDSYSKVKSVDQSCLSAQFVVGNDVHHINCSYRDENYKLRNTTIDFDLNQVPRIGAEYGIDPLEYGIFAGNYGSDKGYLFSVNSAYLARYFSRVYNLSLIDTKTGLTIWDPKLPIDPHMQVRAVYNSAEGKTQLLMKSRDSVFLTR